MRAIVIADDLTGAAEIAGIAWRYNISTALTTSAMVDTSADMLVYCTDTRSVSREEAMKITEHIADKIRTQAPGFLYKKIDSVYRGYVVGEVKAIMHQLGYTKALIIGANPSLGRTITHGHYYIHGKPIHETGFAHDPEFPVTHSSITKMLGDEVQVLKHTDALPDHGIIAGEASSTTDLQEWANKISNDWLLVGAGDFFTALLEKHHQSGKQAAPSIALPHLFVRGTAYPDELGWVEAVQEKYDGVVYLPVNCEQSSTWLSKARAILEKRKKLLLAYQGMAVPPGITAAMLRTNMANAVKRLVEQHGIKELFIEGGSTAASILQALHCTTLAVVYEWQRGVVKLQHNDLYITVKPGSYALHGTIKKFYLTE
jgi:uncharacterized protein YgbK (DUF1537 family)